MIDLRLALAAMLFIASVPTAARSRHHADPLPIAGDYALPNPDLTPGGVDPNVTLSDICNGTTKGRRSVSAATRAKVLADYNMPAIMPDDYELDHLVPLALGGNNAAANLWPQPAPDYHLKDELEVEMQNRACAAFRTLQPAEAAEVLRQEQREIAEDWPAAARRYLGRQCRRDGVLRRHDRHFVHLPQRKVPEVIQRGLSMASMVEVATCPVCDRAGALPEQPIFAPTIRSAELPILADHVLVEIIPT